ncbi:DUF6531 domain-containing protein [Streptomyces sp. H39-C1]|uniref:DUF6531 domain-containing protein n=1 Tax=Streptomyces sp. H39-C1 TaxID=3004355 RepID=UPI0022AEA1FA|nr:DUF6531 domain-containing protein [Streptomyces sp. H39-C1]MCZ4103437.1 DUF6531 domain-containing protein [Streptomyces sp. H39-C1]
MVAVVLSVVAGGGWLSFLPAQQATAQAPVQQAAGRGPAPVKPQKPMTLAERRKQVGFLPPRTASHALPPGHGVPATAQQVAETNKRRSGMVPAPKSRSAVAATKHSGLVYWQVTQDPFGNTAAQQGGWLGSLGNHMGAAVPGEPLMVSSAVYQTGGDPNVVEWHPVKVSYQITNYCNDDPVPDIDFNQVVSAPSWGFTGPTAPTPPVVNTVITLPPKPCTKSDPLYFVHECVRVMDDSADTGGCGSYNHFAIVPILPVDATRGCICGDASGSPRSDVLRGDPVNTATGAFAESFADAAVSAPGISFTANRSYASDVAASGVLGRGWLLPWESSLEVLSGGNVTLHAEGGALHPFTKASGGTFTAPGWARSSLVVDGPGYRLTTPDHRTLTYDGTGHLTAMKDSSGQGLTLAYTGGQVSSITDAAGRTVALAYTGGRLSKLTLADGRHVDYGYTGAQLTSVTALDGAVSTYGYDTAGLLNAVTDALGHRQVFNVYDAQGRVTSQTAADGAKTSYAYTKTGVFDEVDTTAPDGGVWTDIYATNLLFTQIDPLGNKSYYRYDGHYNRDNAIDGEGRQTSWDYYASGQLKDRLIDGYENWTYDAAGNLATYKDSDYHTTTYGYDPQNRLISAKDALLHETTYTYWPNGQRKTQKTPLGPITNYEYDATGNLTTVTTPEGRKTTRTYDASGRLKTVVDPRGNATGADPAKFTTTYGYDDGDRITSVTDARGHLTASKYDLAGNLKTVTDAANRVTTYDYDPANRLKTTTDPLGKTTTAGYDLAGRQISVIDRTGAKTTYGYDKAGRLIQTVTARGYAPGAKTADFTWTYGYDKVGNRKTTTDPQGHTIAFDYDAKNQPTTTTDALAHKRTVTYDREGNATKRADALGHDTTFVFDAANRLTATKTNSGDTTTYEFDNDGNLAAQVTPLKERTTFGYDKDGLRTSSVDPRGNATGANPADYTTTVKYDEAGQPVAVTDPLGHLRSTGYDANGNVISTTDARGRTATTSYDVLDRVESTIGADGGKTVYSYNPAGQAETKTDANNHITTYGYDAEGRTTSIKDPLTHIVSLLYDPEGNTAQVTNARGQSITSTLDARNLITKTTYSDATPAVSYTYDAAGRPATVTDATGSRTLTFDDADKLLTATSPGVAKPFTYTYFNDNTIKTRAYPDGSTTTYGYDTDQRIKTATVNGKATSYGYDLAGNLTSTTLPSTPAVTETRTYDRAGQLASLSQGAGARQYGRDGDGRVITDQYKDATTAVYRATRYDYDPAGRVARACADTGATSCLTGTTGESYTYDKTGNRATATTVAGTTTTKTTNTYDAADQLTQAVTGTTTTLFGYDNDGNQTKVGATASTYDPAGRLTTSTTGTTAAAFTYDSDGNRTTTKKNNTLVGTSRWDINNPMPQLATDTDGAGALVGDYHYDPAGRPQSVDRSATSSFSYLHDRQGSVRSVIDTAAKETYKYTYGTFGATTGTATVAGGQQSVFGYTGQAKDSALPDRVNLRARSYDTTTGRFTSRDPISAATGSPNTSSYAYANNDPVNQSDPSGACPLCISAVVGGVIGGVVGAGIYALQHRDGPWDWGDFASATGKGTVIGIGAGLLAPIGGASAAAMGLEGASATWAAAGINAAIGAGYNWAVNTVQCQPTTPMDLLIGAAGGGGGTLIGPAFKWTKGLFGKGGTTASPRYGPGAAHADDPAFNGGGFSVSSMTEEEGVNYLYRGLSTEHPGYDDAIQGIATPRGGHSNIPSHHDGNTKSIYTSWTTDKETALRFARGAAEGRNDLGGVIIQVKLPLYYRGGWRARRRRCA